MQVIKQADGSKMVILTGRAADSIVENMKRNPPPFDAVTYHPVSFFDSRTQVQEPLFDPEAGAIFDKLNREVEHYQGLEAAKGRLLEEQARVNLALREQYAAQQRQHDRDLEQASVAIENLRAELVTLGEQFNAAKLAAKPEKKPRKLATPARKALPSANGTHKRSK